MKDKVNLTMEEFGNIFENVGSIALRDHMHFKEVFLTEEISLPSYELCVNNLAIWNFNYNSVTKVLTVYAGKDLNNRVKFTADCPHVDETFHDIHFRIQFYYKDEIQQMKWTKQCMDAHSSPVDMATNMARIFWSINFYITHLPSTMVIQKDKVEETYLVKKGHDKRYKSRTVLQSTIYIHAKKLSDREIKHVIKCLCWGVRGHFRTLKSGKVVWIKPYKKGKQKDNENAYVGKEYVA